MTIPVVFVHEGDQDYLRVAIRQAQRHNDRVVLLGDKSNSSFGASQHGLVQQLGSQHFVDSYRHMSHNHVEGALRGMMRWFCLLEWMERSHEEIAFYCDSDAMLYCNVDEVVESYPEGWVAALQIPQKPLQLASASGHFSVWTRDALRDFRAFMERMYVTERGLAILQTKWAWHMLTQTPGGVGDMTHLFLWSLGKNIVNNAKVIGGAVFDHNINIPANYTEGEYRMNGAIKDIIVDGPGDYWLWRKGERIRVNGLHFQGQAKGLMKEYEG